jgi:histidinol phosphatase-like enzyme
MAGQEMGSKEEHIEIVSNGKYDKDKVLMVGDAIGDMKAAMKNSCLFYPINPGNEVASWKRFYDEAFDKFISGQYAGSYEKKLIEEFDKYLPENPPWLK